jgi:hypothetical protein
MDVSPIRQERFECVAIGIGSSDALLHHSTSRFDQINHLLIENEQKMFRRPIVLVLDKLDQGFLQLPVNSSQGSQPAATTCPFYSPYSLSGDAQSRQKSLKRPDASAV